MLGKFGASIMAYLHSWFVVSPAEKDSKKIKELVFFLVGVFLAIVFGVVVMPVILMWAGWLLCWWILLHVIQASIDKINQYPRKTRILGAVLLTVVFIGVFAPIAYGQWRREQAALLEGDLLGGDQSFNDGQVRMIPPVQVGRSGTIIFQPPGSSPFWQPFPDAKLKLEAGKKGPMVSTTIRDADGHIVASIEKNHWKVFSFCADKNYTSDGQSLEILDSSLHVVFQLRLLPSFVGVQVQGEWWDNQGNGKRILENANGPGSIVEFLGPRQKKNEDLIKPMFVYPSSEHWQELVR